MVQLEAQESLVKGMLGVVAVVLMEVGMVEVEVEPLKLVTLMEPPMVETVVFGMMEELMLEEVVVLAMLLQEERVLGEEVLMVQQVQ
jgi:hypothetical protein